MNRRLFHRAFLPSPRPQKNPPCKNAARSQPNTNEKPQLEKQRQNRKPAAPFCLIPTSANHLPTQQSKQKNESARFQRLLFLLFHPLAHPANLIVPLRATSAQHHRRICLRRRNLPRGRLPFPSPNKWPTIHLIHSPHDRRPTQCNRSVSR